VTTAVFPQCAIGAGTGENPVVGRCGSFKKDDQTSVTPPRYNALVGRGGTWSQECTNPACYGVPLYRQLLTGDASSGEWKTWTSQCTTPTGDPTKPACRFPFVRMGGQSTYQRSSLTVNHGVYFLDTSVKQDTQQKTEAFSPVTECSVTASNLPCSPRSVNVFLGGQTYYVYFLFAKTSTKQTYQIYVGPGFNKSTIQAVQTDLTVMPVQKFTNIAWPEGWGTPVYTDPGKACTTANGVKPGDGCGILTITIDMKNQTALQPVSSSAVNSGLCKPEKFCKATGTTCGCALTLDAKDPFKTQCDKACGQWAVKDVDFPDAGAYGFSFTLPQGFSPDDNGQFHRPTPTTFATQTVEPNFNWLTTLQLDKTTVPVNGGACTYSKVPPNCQ
jgi:hypothetical protein